MTGDNLIFIHLSDIHFKRCSGSEYDVEEDIRNEILLDAAEASQQLGRPEGILVAGDIAFSGIAEEYDVAKKWLANLCEKVGRTPENIWCVPGNHDVDRSQIKKSVTLSSIHTQLRQSNQKEIDGQMLNYLGDSEAASIIFRPVTEYNKFAAAFGCQTNQSKTSWHRDFALNDGWTLRINGLNTTIVSSHLDWPAPVFSTSCYESIPHVFSLS